MIADFKKGGQNDHIEKDPCVLPRVDQILPHLYERGWFYQFPTIITERRYLGVKHPITGVVYRYRGLPMGSRSSRAIACRMGLAFLRKLRERFREFQGRVEMNCWMTHLHGKSFRPWLARVR